MTLDDTVEFKIDAKVIKWKRVYSLAHEKSAALLHKPRLWVGQAEAGRHQHFFDCHYLLSTVSRSSKVKGQGHVQLPVYGFLIVPIVTMGLSVYRLATRHFHDRHADQ